MYIARQVGWGIKSLSTSNIYSLPNMEIIQHLFSPTILSLSLSFDLRKENRQIKRIYEILAIFTTMYVRRIFSHATSFATIHLNMSSTEYKILNNPAIKYCKSHMHLQYKERLVLRKHARYPIDKKTVHRQGQQKPAW